MKFSSLFRFGALSGAALLMLASTASAHTGHSETSGFTHGFAHPLGGLDHVLAMIAVGLWAAQLAASNPSHKRALWMVPLAFVAMLTAGAVAGFSGLALPGVEIGITASVLVLGVLLATAVRCPLLAGMAIVGIFAIFHGFAHGAEMPQFASGLSYGLGFICATILLHAAGIGFALGAGKLLRAPNALPLRLAGAAIIVSGVMLFIG